MIGLTVSDGENSKQVTFFLSILLNIFSIPSVNTHRYIYLPDIIHDTRDAPPTLQCNFGSISWTISANVHRPGTFKTKLSAQREIVVVSCPTEEDTEDTENIIVERHWDQQLQYLITISGRSFYIGGTIPISFTMMPLTKVKIHRLSVFIEGWDYWLSLSSFTYRCRVSQRKWSILLTSNVLREQIQSLTSSFSV